jgi:hypothetical protein
MTQLGEAVQIGMVDEDEIKCPFDHLNPEPPKVQNQFIGEGGKLATRMGNGTSTHLYDPLKTVLDPVENPKYIVGHALFDKQKIVHVVDRDLVSGAKFDHYYPVTCAAHHLVPAQESLKVCRLLAFMVKKGEAGKLKDKDFTAGAVWANVGYEVNGIENGVYLPGSYAVGGGRGGMGLWSENDDVPDSEDESASDLPDPASPLLSGELNEISETNRKWRYVRQAMFHGKGQFHDRHEDYSRFIAEVLNKIFSDYRRQYTRSVREGLCPDCKAKADKIKDVGIPTPFGLVGRLNALSQNIRVCLNGSTWRPNIYTSKWGAAFMRELKAGNKSARLMGGEGI